MFLIAACFQSWESPKHPLIFCFTHLYSLLLILISALRTRVEVLPRGRTWLQSISGSCSVAGNSSSWFPVEQTRCQLLPFKTQGSCSQGHSSLVLDGKREKQGGRSGPQGSDLSKFCISWKVQGPSVRHRAASHHATEHHAAECVQDWSAKLLISAGFRAEVGASQVE